VNHSFHGRVVSSIAAAVSGCVRDLAPHQVPAGGGPVTVVAHLIPPSADAPVQVDIGDLLEKRSTLP
jgi:hypothetical protein